MSMKLYGSYTSPFVRHVRIVLAEEQLDCAFVETAGGGPKNKSPTKKVPYLEDGEIGLNDSSSIIKHLREKAGGQFLPELRDFDLYCLVNTLMDSAINVFLFERVDGTLPQDSKYLGRQMDRVASGLAELEARPLPQALPLGDAQLRLACFLDWGLFRNRFRLEGHPKLQAFLELAQTSPFFTETAPPKDA